MHQTPEFSGLRVANLADYRALAITGTDRVEFLQGQFTQDVAGMSPGDAALTGWASAKGRLLAVGQLIATAEGFLWPLPGDVIDGVQHRLGMFRLRSQVDIDISDLRVFGLSIPESGGNRASLGGIVSPLIGDAGRAFLLADHEPDSIDQSLERNDWSLLDVRAGLPTVVAATSEAFVPQMLNLDLLGGISFTKGCYVGQEIVARTQNLGRIKRRMFRFGGERVADLQPGATIYGPDNATGKVVMAATGDDTLEATAVVAIDQATGEWFADQSRNPCADEPAAALFAHGRLAGGRRGRRSARAAARRNR